MFDELVLGVDPGTAAVGMAVVAGGARPSVRWAGTLRPSSELSEEARLRHIHDQVASAIAAHGPAALAIERLLWGRNTGSAMGVARASGVIILAAAQAGMDVEEYAPLEVKMAVTGQGNATKDAVRRSLTHILGVKDVPVAADAVDAVAVAVCHL